MSDGGITLIGGRTTTKQRLWDDEFSKVSALSRDAADFVSHLTFQTGEECAVVCIDERVQPHGGPFAKMNLWRLPGCGILLGKDLEDSLDKAVRLLRGKVSVITWHLGCGAVAEAMRRFGLRGDVNKLAKWFANELARRLGVNCREIICHGPIDFHFARGAVYDDTGIYQASAKMPEMFVISRKLIGDPDIALSGLVMARGIAASAHGFGNRFEDQKFQIFVMTDDARRLPELLKEVASQRSNLSDSEVHGVVVAP